MRAATSQQRINELFDNSGLKDTEIAASLGVSKQSVSSWRSGIRSPKKSILIRIADYFHVDVAWLLGFDDDPPQAPLRDDEERLVGLYRQLNRQGQELVMQTAVTAVRSELYLPGDGTADPLTAEIE